MDERPEMIKNKITPGDNIKTLMMYGAVTSSTVSIHYGLRHDVSRYSISLDIISQYYDGRTEP